MCQGAKYMLKQHAFHLLRPPSPSPPLPILLLISLWLASMSVVS